MDNLWNTRPNSLDMTLTYLDENGNTVSSDDYQTSINAGNNTTQELAPNWTAVLFTGLKVYQNPTGTTVLNGTSENISYTVTEDTNNAAITKFYNVIKESDTNDIVPNESTRFTVKNELKTRTLKVKKVWDDGVFVENGTQAMNWFDTHYAVDAIITQGTTNIAKTLTIPKDVEFAEIEVPAFIWNTDKTDVIDATYSVTEDTAAGKKQYGYLDTYENQNFTEGTTDDEKNTATIINTLPLKHYTVTKTWNDDNNRDGKRPDSLTFKLNRSSDTSEVDPAFTVVSKTATPASGWTADFGYYPAYAADNTTQYAFVMKEENVPNVYTQVEKNASADTDDEKKYLVDSTQVESKPSMYDKTVENSRPDITVVHYQFENRYTPEKGGLKVDKNWIGDKQTTGTLTYNYTTYTRPDVKVTLYCKYTGSDSWHKVSEDEFITSIMPSGYEYVKTLGTSDNGTVTFSDLPLWANPTYNDGTSGTASNGQAVEVTYTVLEETTTTGESLIGYNSTYKSTSDSTVAFNTSNTGTVLTKDSTATLNVENRLKKGSITIDETWNDNGAVDATDAYHYDVKVTVTANSVGYNSGEQTVTTPANSTNATQVTLTELPLYDKTGKAVDYTMTEVNTTKYGYVTTYDADTATNVTGNNIKVTLNEYIEES